MRSSRTRFELQSLLTDQESFSMSKIREYKINVPQEKIDWLKRKLEDYTWPEELEDGGDDYGATKYKQ